MQRFITTRILALASAAFTCVGVSAQSTLPATNPTAVPSATVAPLNATAPQVPANKAHRADVRYESGLLSINANNSSLNQILREIARLTGMKITGGVKDERVFGHYGPAAPADLLGTLIDGTGTNMLLRQTEMEAPVELVLTPRGGGATPPNPNAPGFEDDARDDEERPTPPQQQGPPPPIGFRGIAQAPQPANTTSVNTSIAQPINNVNGSSQNVTPTASQIPTTNSVPIDSLATPSTTPASTGIVDTPNMPSGVVVNPIAAQAAAIGAASQSAGSTTGGTGSNASTPSTPEQIFQQLQQMRQRQQQSGTTTNPPSSTTTAPQ